MPTARIPLVGTMNQRGLSGTAALTLNEDQRFKNCVFSVVTNPVTGKSSVYCEKRPGWATDSLVENGSASTGLCKPQSFDATLSAFGDTNSTIYFGTTSVGVITGRALHFTETLISGVGCVAIKSSDGTGWYYMDGAKDVTAYTGDTHTNTTIDNLGSTAGMYVGQKISGTGIVAGTRIAVVNSSTAITTDTATTGTATVAITKEPIAKIIDSDFATSTVYQSAFAPMDGYLFYATDNGYVNNSDLNSVSAYTSGARVAVQQSPDPSVAVAVQKNTVVVFGLASNEKYQNAGYSSGSPLQVLKPQVEHIGTLDQRSVTQLEDDIFYASTPYEGDIGIQRMRNLQSTRISTPVLDKILGTAATDGAIYASSFRLGGYPYASFVLSMAADGPASNLLLESGDALLLESGDNLLLEDTAAQTSSFIRMEVYNATLNIWSEWDCNQATYLDSVGSGTSNKLVATSRMNTSGKVYRIDPASDGQLYTDDGSAFTMEIRTAKLDLGTGKRKFVKEVELLGADSQAGNTPYLSYSDDDYETWSTPRPFDTSGPQPKLTRVGSHKGGRAYKITDASNAPFRAEALGITFSVAS